MRTVYCAASPGVLVSIALLALFACAPDGAGLVALDGPGGDAWAFHKRLSGKADASCAEVWVESPRGRVVATRDGDRFSAYVPLAEGLNDVVPECVLANGKERAGAAQPWDVRLADRPRAFGRAAYADAGLQLDAGGSAPSEVRGAPIVAWSWSARDGNPAPIEVASTGADLGATPFEGATLVVSTPAEDGDYVVDVTVTDADGVTDTAAVMFRVGWGEAWALDVDTENPAWVDEAVVYGVVPFFFGERGFADVTDRLDELEALGVTALWLSPITDCPDDDFGYAVTDHFALRDTFGSDEDFRAFVDAAHARGMRVLMDFVPNHTSDEHPYYKRASDPGSPYQAWYDWETPNYFGWENLPNLDYDNPEVRRYVIEAFAFWVREYGIDGFRADVAWGPQGRAPEFWPEWRTELKRIDPDLLLLAEASGRDAYWWDNGFDVAYDWTWELGEWAWQSAWDDPQRTAELLRDALTNEGEGFDDDALIFRFLNNNDTGERFVTKYGAEKVPVAATLMLTLPGVPCVFTGDEVGAAFEPYDEGPVLTWEDANGFTPLYTTLIRLRRDLDALHSRDWALLDASPEDAIVAYVRRAEDPEQNVLVVLNLSGERQTARLDLGEDVEAMLGDGLVYDLLNEEDVRIDAASPEVSLPAYGARVIGGPAI